MKYTVASFTVLILTLVIVIVWLSGGFSSSAPQAIAQNSGTQTQSSLNLVSNPVATTVHTPAGATCDNPISWQQAKQYIGQTVAMIGPMMRVTSRDNVRGNPTWIDIGAVYPNTQRLVLVIWGAQKANFPTITTGDLIGKNICVIGLVQDYKGTPQIELKAASQLSVPR